MRLASGDVNSKGPQRATSITEEDIYVVRSELHTASMGEQSVRTYSDQRTTPGEKIEATESGRVTRKEN